MSTGTRNENFPAEHSSSLLKSIVDLEKINTNLFRSKPLSKHTAARSIYGGQLIGQALAAACQGVPENQHLHSLHSYFLSKEKTLTCTVRGDCTNHVALIPQAHKSPCPTPQVQAGIPVLYHVENIRDGRTYCARSVKAVQSGAVVFTMQASFKQEETTGIVHQLPMPKVPYPDGLQTMSETLNRLYEAECRRINSSAFRAIEVLCCRYKPQKRISETDYSFGTAWYDAFPAIAMLVEPDKTLLQKPSYPRRHVWLQAKDHLGEELHQNMHKCCVVYLSDSFLLQTALFCLAPISSTSSIFHTSLDHSVWFHAPCRADQWLLYQVETQYLGDGRALCQGRMWDTDGTLLVTVVQEGVMRHDKVVSRL